MGNLLPMSDSYSSGRYYAIPMNNSGHRQWDNLNETTSVVIYDWSEIHAHIHNAKNNLTIAVAQANPEESVSGVKHLVAAIQNTANVQEHDRIFGIIDQKIEKLGFIKKAATSPANEVVFTIQWAEGSNLGKVEGNVFNDYDEIQHLKVRQLKKIHSQFGNSLNSIYETLPAFRDDWGSRSQIINLKAKSEPLEVITAPKEDKGGLIKVFYGTNRRATKNVSNIQAYSSESSNELQYGYCEVQVPRGHTQGELERPGKILIWNLPENQNKHVILKSVIPSKEDAFFVEFKKHLSQSAKKSALLFVHGYNTSFEEAARRTAQLAWDLPFDGNAGFFSWPSSGKIPAYLADESKARSSTPAFKLFMQQILDKTELEELHIIAHSMGSLVTTLSLNELRRNTHYRHQLVRIKQLILGAPDIDKEEFRNTILPEFKNIGVRRTIYASDHDFPLTFSSFIRSSRNRLGQIGNDIFLDNYVDTIEASNIASESSHSYIFESKILLGDLFFLITQGLSPKDRRLREIKKGNLPYWLFPK